MVVDKNVYPDRSETPLSGMQLTSTQPSTIALDSEWETSIAISQSTSDLAAFNKVTYVTYDPSHTDTFHEVENIKTVQKIGLYYTQDYVNFARNQVYNGSVTYDGTSYFIGDTSSAYYSFYSLRRRPASGYNGGLVTAMQNRYSKAAYYLITGLDLQKVIGVICVGFTDGSYCSYKYYEDHKASITKTLMCMFMIGLIDSENLVGVRTICPIDMTDFSYTFFTRNQQTGNISNDSRDIQYLLPNGIIGPQTHIGDRNIVGSINVGALVFPLVACMAGRRINTTNYWNLYSLAGTPIYGGTSGVDYTIVNESGWIHTVLSQAGYDSALKAAACYGIPFSLDFPTNTTNFYDQDLTTFLPQPNAGGYFNGNYDMLTNNGVKTELYNTDPIFNGGKNAPYNGRDYDPDIPIPEDSIDLNVPAITPMNLFNKTYILNHDKVKEFANFLFRTMVDDSSFWKTILTKSLELYGGGINAVTSLKMYPFDVRAVTSASSEGTVIIGACPVKDGEDNLLQGYILPDNANVVLNLGSFKIFKKYNNFLDYGPYTSISLYIPYVGSVNLDPNIYMDHTVSVKMVVDLTTGVCTAVVYSDDNMVTYHKGAIGIDVPINGVNANNNDRTMVGNALGWAAMGIGMAGTALGAPMAVVGAMAGLTAKAGQEIGSYDSVPMNNGGQASPGCGLYMPNYCYVTIARPKMAFSSNAEVNTYNHEVGYTTSKPTTMYQYLQSLGTVNGATISGELANTFNYQSYTGNLSPDELNEIANIVRQGVKFGILVFPG